MKRSVILLLTVLTVVASAHRQGNLTDHRIPTLDEVMPWARGKTILMLDKKEVPVKEVVGVIARCFLRASASLRDESA